MRKIIDTNIFIDHLRGKYEAQNFLLENINQGVEIVFSVITRIELWSGMRKGEEKEIEKLLMPFRSIAVTNEIALMAGDYMNCYRKSHGLTIPDAIIAASAKHENAYLVTLNIKHFPMEDIQIIKPY